MPVRPCLDAMDQFAAVFDLNSVTDDTLWKADGAWVRSAFLEICAIGSTYEESPPAPVPGLAKRSVLVPRPESQLMVLVVKWRGVLYGKRSKLQCVVKSQL